MAIKEKSQKIQNAAWLSKIKEFFNVRPVIVEVRPGETREDSWKRHLNDHPEANNANVRIFNWA